MKAVRRLNNNVVLCIDDKGNEFIARGKGIGFHELPYEIKLSQIERTYYNVDKHFFDVMVDISDDLIILTTKIIDYARDQIDVAISSSAVFTLADHINFALKRYQENLNVKLPIAYDIQYLFEKEYKVGKYALKLVNDSYHVHLSQEEACYIAMHIINAEEKQKDESLEDEQMIEKITQIIERVYQICINKRNFNYSRFVTHMHYLLKRGKKKTLVKSENKKIYQSLVTEYPKSYKCSELISEYLKKQIDIYLNDEEKLYLILHINRLCEREECNQ